MVQKTHERHRVSVVVTLEVEEDVSEEEAKTRALRWMEKTLVAGSPSLGVVRWGLPRLLEKMTPEQRASLRNASWTVEPPASAASEDSDVPEQ